MKFIFVLEGELVFSTLLVNVIDSAFLITFFIFLNISFLRFFFFLIRIGYHI